MSKQKIRNDQLKQEKQEIEDFAKFLKEDYNMSISELEDMYKRACRLGIL